MATGNQQVAHGRCGAKKRGSEGTCARPAGWGTDHVGAGRCRVHGGNTATHTKSAHREQAQRAVHQYGLPVATDPHTALLDELHRTAGHVAWLSQILGEGKLGERDVFLDQSTKIAGRVPSVWVELYQRERKHLADVAKTCIAVGIEERRVELAEQQGALLVQVIRGVLDDLGVSDRPEVPDVVRRHLTLVAG